MWTSAAAIVTKDKPEESRDDLLDTTEDKTSFLQNKVFSLSFLCMQHVTNGSKHAMLHFVRIIKSWKQVN